MGYVQCIEGDGAVPEATWELRADFTWLGGEDEQLAADESLTECVKLPFEDVPVMIDRPGDALDYNVAGIYTACVSERFRDTLAPFVGDSVQFIPARIEAAGKWYIPNLLRSVDCIDARRSKLLAEFPPGHPRAGEYSAVLQMAVRESACWGQHWFRPARWQVASIMSEAAAQAVRMAGLVGIDFLPIISVP